MQMFIIRVCKAFSDIEYYSHIGLGLLFHHSVCQLGCHAIRKSHRFKNYRKSQSLTVPGTGFTRTKLISLKPKRQYLSLQSLKGHGHRTENAAE